ncbi:type 4a pilus biogenesis protein PilO [Opitutaceae bacterium]|nr:type 4a pilus biogenesis protein PilO [Opitutaceae bacterium]
MLDRFKEFLVEQRFVSVCIAVILTSLVGIWWVGNQLDSYKTELSRMTDHGTETLGLVAMRNMLQNELDVAQNAVQRTEENLVFEENLADNLWYFYSIESKTETRLTELRQLDPYALSDGESYKRVPYELSATGDFVGISEFIRQLEIGPRLVRIQEFTLRKEMGEDEQLSLDLNLEMLGSP